MITNHTDLLNALIEKYKLKSYLEIGVQNPANNFDKVKCEYKQGVDPETKYDNVFKMTSDTMFQLFPQPAFDLIFIDGLHHADQVKRDFENSLRCLSDNGFIVIHDVLPENEAGTKVPRETKQWWGDVYKFAMDMNNYPVSFKTFDIDNGCMLVWKDNDRINYNGRIINANWNDYLSYGHKIMNVTSTVEI